ncbi:hypothetical protein ACNUKZ_15265 (plasmid) [Clostridium perfringens]|uniref:hypothetical protein n=1 Tax=Clostridium perfringens TaxID=1502 RepID=UPI003B0081F1
MTDIELLINQIKLQISRANQEIELNIILSNEEKKTLVDNWDYIREDLTNYITSSNLIMYALEKDSKGRNILNIRF